MRKKKVNRKWNTTDDVIEKKAHSELLFSNEVNCDSVRLSTAHDFLLTSRSRPFSPTSGVRDTINGGLSGEYSAMPAANSDRDGGLTILSSGPY